MANDTPKNQPTLSEAGQNPKIFPYRGVYDPNNPKPYKISRSKIELFINCPRCFYLDRRVGIPRPSFPPFLINQAIDTLLKKEFDAHRAEGKPHPLMEKYKIDAVPLTHEQMDDWRENFKGVEFHHKPTNLWVHGAVDDIWQSPNQELIVVDYKATAKEAGVSIEGKWQQSYKRQLEVYQWLLRQLGHSVANLGYFVYANGRTDRKAFDQKVEFDISVIPYEGDDSWVEKTLTEIHQCLNAGQPPNSDAECEYCTYSQRRKQEDL